jgi:hypothetical protein
MVETLRGSLRVRGRLGRSEMSSTGPNKQLRLYATPSTVYCVAVFAVPGPALHHCCHACEQTGWTRQTALTAGRGRRQGQGGVEALQGLGGPAVPTMMSTFSLERQSAHTLIRQPLVAHPARPAQTANPVLARQGRPDNKKPILDCTADCYIRQ